ncbi:MAG: hypothetical protein K2M55_07570 [Muribaculaceae bacterium]|nr:hypothetical protein [Muribaculaceae bacterium]
MLSRRSFYALSLCAVLPFLAVSAPQRRTPDISPQIPQADRSAGNRVFLERADRLLKTEEDSFMTVVGDVVFTKDPMIMHCDSAHYFVDTESMQAFGNVSMEQGDTLFVYADELNYDGLSEIATLYADTGKKVRLINRDVTLETDVFIYDLGIDLGYYDTGGKLYDPSNVLTSLKGEYVPSTKEANFYRNVHLNSRNSTGSDTLDIYSDTLYYNTDTHVAQLFSPSMVVNSRGTIYTREGIYDTDSNKATLYDRSLIVTTQGQTLTADTIIYDRAAGFGEAFGNMVLTDTAKKVEIHGNYGFYNELIDTSFVTGRAMLKHYSEADTLYMHGRFIRTWAVYDTVTYEADTLAGTPAWTKVDTSHVAVVHPRVRFYRSDMQGVADSMMFTQADTTLRMFRTPIVWNEEQQITGSMIELHLNDSTIESAYIPEQAFAAQLIEGDHYQQLSGKKMKAAFVGGELRQLDVDGNVEIIMYPEENDSTINKMVSANSSFMTVLFRGRTTESVRMWPQTKGQVTPLFLARRSMYFLPKFRWYDGIRPTSPEDIFIVPEAQEALYSTPTE